MILSHRDRLLLTFADLASYGIAARGGFGAGPDEARVVLAAELAARHPHGLGSYVFWTEADDDGFDGDGWLTAGLMLHVSGDEIVPALEAATRSFGLSIRCTGQRTLEVEVGHERNGTTRFRPALHDAPLAP